VPAGLGNLNASLQALAEFFEIDPHLISAAARSSPKAESALEPDLESAVAKLSREECESHLKDILRGEPGAILSLKKRLTKLSGRRSPAPSPSRRPVGDVFEQAEKIKADAKRKAQAEAERKRIQRLEKLAEDEENSWAYLENLLGQKRGSAYDQATHLLVELRDMAEYKHRRTSFQERFRSIRARFGKSVALTERFRRVGLI